MVRVPYAHGPSSTRIELRSPDPSGNVYLQIATFIAMGLAGLDEELDPGDADLGSTYKRDHSDQKLWDTRFLPRSMYEALVEAEKSEFLEKTFGAELFANYIALKAADWEDHRTHITPREHEKYLRI